MPDSILNRFCPELPSGWSTERIGDCLTQVIHPIRMKDSEAYRLVSIRRRNNGMFDRHILKGKDILTKDLQKVIPNSFAIARRQIIHGACTFVDDDFANAAVSSSYSIFLGTGKCDARYFSWLAQHPLMYAYFVAASHGIVIEKMNFDQERWLGFSIRLPPLREQRRIVEILDSVDESIRSTERLIEKLRQARTGLLSDLLRDDGSKGYLGIGPSSWRTEALGYLADIAGGVALGRSLPGSGVIELPYLRVANVQDGYIDASDIKSVRVARSEVRRYELAPGDFLMTEGGDFDKLGRGAVWDGSIAPCLHQNHIFRVRTDRSRLLPEFLAMYVGSFRARRYFVGASKQTTNLATINMTQVRAFPLPVPPLSEQERIASTLASYDEQVQAHVRELGMLRHVRQGMMNDLLTGRVRVLTEEA
ncbi:MULTISPECIES: restriction endonuclease subunit S [unclassified Micromonospora]|uniref:restriction endonuclease subunit S n=1 Tax=unclassified Micromonospora TaxID=2617518 RepID=UPI0036361052